MVRTPDFESGNEGSNPSMPVLRDSAKSELGKFNGG